MLITNCRLLSVSAKIVNFSSVYQYSPSNRWLPLSIHLSLSVFATISSSSAAPLPIFNPGRPGKKLSCIQAMKFKALLDCISAPPKQGRCQEIHPLRPRDFTPCSLYPWDFPQPSRFHLTLEISLDLWDFPWPLRFPLTLEIGPLSEIGRSWKFWNRGHIGPFWTILDNFEGFDSFKVARIINNN